MYEALIHTKRNGQKPTVRETAQKFGMSSLSDHELLMIILGSGTKTMPVEKLAMHVLETIKNTHNDTIYDHLYAIPGIGQSKASQICAALELGKRQGKKSKILIRSPQDILPFFEHAILHPTETFLCASLNGAHEIMKVRMTSCGSVTRAIVDPREIFCEPLKERASGIIVCHNHPSGNYSPSSNDIAVTRQLEKAGELLGIQLLDHIIISINGYYSFSENNLIKKHS